MSYTNQGRDRGIGLLMKLLGLFKGDPTGFWNMNRQLETMWGYLTRVLETVQDWQSHKMTDEEATANIRRISRLMIRPIHHLAGWQPDDFGAHIALVLQAGKLQELGFVDTLEYRKRFAYALSEKLWYDDRFLIIVRETLNEHPTLRRINPEQPEDNIIELPESLEIEERFAHD